MSEAPPFYKLKELILNKYGEEKFTTGCAMVAWWLSYATKTKYSIGWVEVTCDIKEASSETYILGFVEEQALRDLFKLQSVFDLYTNPQTVPFLSDDN